VVFKDLQKLVNQSQRKQNSSNDVLDMLRDKPFWIWNIDEHKQEAVDTKGVAVLIILLVYLSSKKWKNQSLIMKNYCTILS
jgi:hypothetical protein